RKATGAPTPNAALSVPPAGSHENNTEHQSTVPDQQRQEPNSTHQYHQPFDCQPVAFLEHDMECGMSQRNARSSAPPLSHTSEKASRSAGAVPTGREAKTTGGRRGRPSSQEYAKRVCEALRYDLVQLEGCTALAQLPGVQATRKHQTKTFLP